MRKNGMAMALPRAAPTRDVLHRLNNRFGNVDVD
jgi:hypothetical protein